MPEVERGIPPYRRHMQEFVYPDYHEWPFPDTFDLAAHSDSALIPDAVKSPPAVIPTQWDYHYSLVEPGEPHYRLDTL